jgi:hypothetical protein
MVFVVMPKSVRLLLSLPLVLALLAGCHRMRAEVASVATSVQRPSNVAVYLSITDASQPVTNLGTGSFTLYEDGQKLDPKGVSLTLLPRDSSVDHRVVLLLDLTGAPSPGERQILARAAAAFVRKVRVAQAVSVYAFDGGAAIRSVKEFPRDAAVSEPADLPELEQIASTDRSRDLNGAVIDGLAHLDATLSGSEKPVRVGTLVLFTAGGDLAGRVPADRVKTELSRSRDRVIAVGMGHDGKLSLDRIGAAGTFRAPSLEGVAQAMDQAADRVLALENGHYLIAYCSPARSGVRELRIEVALPSAKGTPRHVSTKLGFSAEGFSSGCNGSDAPRFVVTLVTADGRSVPGIARDEPPPPANPEPSAKPEPSAEPEEKGEEAQSAAEASEAKPKRPRHRATRPRAAPHPAAAKPAAPPAKKEAPDKGEEKEEPDFTP